MTASRPSPSPAPRRGANLEGVTLFGALATGADFTGANLRAADLELVELEGADLTDAVLEGAMVRALSTLPHAEHTQQACVPDAVRRWSWSAVVSAAVHARGIQCVLPRPPARS